MATVLLPVLFVFLFIDFCRFVENVLYICFDLLSGPILVERGIALDGRRVQGDLPHLCHAGLAAEPDDLDEEVLEVLEMIFAAVADGAENPLLIRGKIPECNVAFEQPVDLPGAADALLVGKDEDFQQD